MSASFKDSNSGTVTVGKSVYNFHYSVIGSGKIIANINNQIRTVEFYVDGNTVHLFDTKGNSIGYKFHSDYRK